MDGVWGCVCVWIWQCHWHVKPTEIMNTVIKCSQEKRRVFSFTAIGNICSSNTSKTVFSMCQHTTAFATSAWSDPLQHKHNSQESSPAARIISPCNTTRLLSCGSPSNPPSLHPLLKALVKWADAPTAGRAPTAGWRQIEPGPSLDSCGFHSLAEIVLQQHWPICPVDGLSNRASWLHSEATHPAITDQRFDFGWWHTHTPSGWSS